MSEEMHPLREMWIKDNLKRFKRAKTDEQIIKALNRAYDETIYHRITEILERMEQTAPTVTIDGLSHGIS